jgi:6,7-dimethyl-8-ribityllumazine synthase
MRTEGLSYTPPLELLKRVRLFVLQTRWHGDLMARLWEGLCAEVHRLGFPMERVHRIEVAGSFELVHAAGAIARHYTWKRGFAQVVSVQGPTQIQSNLRLPPLFQGNFESRLRSEFLLESPGPISYFQPYEPGPADELPAILALGCILKGATEHNQYLAHAVFHQLSALNLTSGVPVILGVLTPDTLKQAWERVPQVADWVQVAFLAWEGWLRLQALWDSQGEPSA